MVEILFEGINKGFPSGSFLKFHRFIFIMSLLATFPPIFDMGERFKESEGDNFSVGKKINKVIPFQRTLPFIQRICIYMDFK
jgi:hypothetical protein